MSHQYVRNVLIVHRYDCMLRVELLTLDKAHNSISALSKDLFEFLFNSIYN